MGKLILFVLCFLLQSVAFADEVNLLKNPGFESRTAQWAKTGSSTFTMESASPLSGVYSAKWNPSATGEFLRSSTYTIPAGLKGTTCLIEMSYLWDTGTAGHILLNVDDGTNNVATLSLEPTSGGVRRKAQLNFTCPTSGTVRFELESTANADEITLDDGHLGSGKNSVQISQAQFYGSWFSPATTNCSWTITNTSVAAVGADTDCPVATVTGGVTAPGTKIPGFTLSNAPAGKYVIRYQLLATNTHTGDTNASCRISDGTLNGPYSSQVDTGNSPDQYGMIVVGHFEYSSPGTRNFNLHCFVSAGTLLIQANGSDAYASVEYFPLQSAEAITLETSGWRVDANISGANPGLGVVAVSSYTPISNPGLTLVNNSGSGVIPAQISCSGSNPSTGTTCSSGDEQLGISFNLPQAGDVKACATFGHHSDAGAAAATGFVFTTFQIVETPNSADTILQEGKGRISSGNEVASSNGRNIIASPVTVCGTFTFASVGKKTLKIMYEQTVGGTVSTSQIYGDAASSNGQRDIHWTIEPLNQSMPAPVFTEVREKVSSSTQGVKMEVARLNCDASSSVVSQIGSWFSSLGNISAGECTGVISGFSATPYCLCTRAESPITTGVAVDCRATSTTAFTMDAEDDAGASATAFDVNVLCVGLK